MFSSGTNRVFFIMCKGGIFMLQNETHDFTDIDEFLKYVDSQNTRDYVVSLKDLSFNVIDETLYLKVENDCYPVRITALPSILNRIRVRGEGIDVLAYQNYDEELKEVLNALIQHCNEEPDGSKLDFRDNVSVMVSGESVNAINSSRYSHIPMQDIVSILLGIIDNCAYFEEQLNCVVKTDYQYTRIKFFTDKIYNFAGVDRKLVIMLKNSENGQGACQLLAGFAENDSKTVDSPIILITAPTGTVHSGSNNIDAVSDNFSRVEASIEKAVMDVKRLEDIEIKKPVMTVVKVGKAIGLPQKYIDYLKNEWSSTSDPTNAAELFISFNDVISKNLKVSEETIEQYQRNNVLKILGIKNWEKYI